MKKLILSILSFSVLCLSGYAQTFEGIIEWKVNTEITDPKLKKDMEDAKAQLNDPQTQAQLKQLEAMENDPQMKAMLENNPQLKQQLEILKSGNIDAFIPTAMIIKIKNNNSLMQMTGGMIDEILYNKSEDQTYMINRNAKTYKKVAKSSQQDNTKKYKVTATSESVKILNYNCKKYIVESTENGKTQKQYVWATDEIKDFDFKNFKDNVKDASYLKDINGMPLKMEIATPQGKMTMEATKMQKQTISDSEFIIPGGFTEIGK